jgi:hypothetical protein
MATKKKSIKKSAKKPAKKIAKKTTKKVIKKAVKKIAKKPAPTKASTKKPAFAKASAGKEKLTLVGVVTHYYDKIKVAIFKVKNPIQIGQKLRFTNIEGIIFEQPIISMQINHENVKKAKKGAIIGMKVKKQVHENNKIYLIK